MPSHIKLTASEADRLHLPRPKVSQKSHLEEAFMSLWEQTFGLECRPRRQYRFHPDRMWRFDFAWPEPKIAVEVDGGLFVGGGHQRGVRFSQDCEKHNAAVRLGWKLLRYTTLDLKQKSEKERSRALAVIREVFEFLQSAGVRRTGLFDKE